MYDLLSGPPTAADCDAILVRSPWSIRTLEGNSSSLRIFPVLSFIFNSLKIAFSSDTARIASAASSLLLIKPAPLKTFAILLTTGSSTAVPPVAIIDLKPAELAISFMPCSLIPLKSWTVSCAVSPKKLNIPVRVSKGSKE